MTETLLENVIIPSVDASARWDVVIVDGEVTSRVPSSTTSPPSLLLPPLCHPHIHLDKPYLLTSSRAPSASHPDYSDLLPQTGSFEEALANTAAAKARFTPDDLYLRGSQLLAASYAHGVTMMRVFVEVDHVVKLAGLEAAVRLKRDFEHILRVQICAFAQDPLFSTEHGPANLQCMQQALNTYSGVVEVLGTTPYVEKRWGGAMRDANQRKNIEWAVVTSVEYGLHLDFHLDYDLEPSQQGMVYSVMRKVNLKWSQSNLDKTVAIGHCTHLTTCNHQALEEYASLIKQCRTPIHFVGLPTSDLYMMGREPMLNLPSFKRKRGRPPAAAPPLPSLTKTRGGALPVVIGTPLPGGRQPVGSLTLSSSSSVSSSKVAATEQAGVYKPHELPRGTMQVPSMIKDYGLDACLGVNNVGNAFTPYGNGDPLQLACWGVGVYHAGTVADAELLYDCVSGRARRAIGLGGLYDEDVNGGGLVGGQGPSPSTGVRVPKDAPGYGVPLPGLLIQNLESMALPGRDGDGNLNVPARHRLSIKDVVWDPPDSALRRVIR